MTPTEDQTSTPPAPDNQIPRIAPPPIPKTTPIRIPSQHQPTATTEPSWTPEDFGLPIHQKDTLAIILLTAVADFCLYLAPGGTGAACVLMAGLLVLFLLHPKKIARIDRLLPVFILILSALMAWRHWWLLHATGWAALFILAAKQQRPDWRLPEAIWATLVTLLQSPLRLYGHITAWQTRKKNQDTSPAGQTKIPMRVILIPLGVCAVFMAIFCAANPIFAKAIQGLGTHIETFFTNLGDYLSPTRAVCWLLWLTLFAALIRVAARTTLTEHLLTRHEALQPMANDTPTQENFASALWTLIMVNILFLAYNGMDSVYLYFKATLPAGITWAAYTHAGCGWSTFALFLSTIVTGYIFRQSMNFHPRARDLKVLSYVWAVQNALLAAGAIRRIQMYINDSGLTHLRITGIYGSILVAAGLGIMVYKVYANRSFLWLFRKDVFAFGITILLLALTPADWICSTYNVKKVLEGKSPALQPLCLKKLSSDALPQLLPLLDYTRADKDAWKQKVVREGIAAILGQHLLELEKQENKRWSTWQGSSVWALQHLRPAREKIYSIVPPAQWETARQRLIDDHNLSYSAPMSW